MNAKIAGEGAERLEDTDDAVAPAANWASLRSFEVQINKTSKVTAPLYANGKQQCPVEVVVDARDENGVQVTLTQQQLKGIKLIGYNTSGEIWSSLDKDERFIYDFPVTREDGVDVPVPTSAEQPEINNQSITRYIVTTEMHAHWVAAEIISPSGAVYRTNTGEGAPGSGKFDSWVKVQPREGLRYGVHDIDFSKVNESNSPFDVDLYYVKFKSQHGNLRIVASDDLTWEEDYYCHMSHSMMSYNQVVYEYGPSREVSFVAGHGVVQRFRVNKVEGQATLARVSMSFFYAPGGEFYRPKDMQYFNQHGNVIRLQFYTTDGANTISVRDFGTRD